MSIENLVDMLSDNKHGEAREVFNSIMSDKINDALNAKKIQIASEFNNKEDTQ